MIFLWQIGGENGYPQIRILLYPKTRQSRKILDKKTASRLRSGRFFNQERIQNRQICHRDYPHVLLMDKSYNHQFYLEKR